MNRKMYETLTDLEKAQWKLASILMIKAWALVKGAIGECSAEFSLDELDRVLSWPENRAVATCQALMRMSSDGKDVSDRLWNNALSEISALEAVSRISIDEASPEAEVKSGQIVYAIRKIHHDETDLVSVWHGRDDAIAAALKLAYSMSEACCPIMAKSDDPYNDDVIALWECEIWTIEVVQTTLLGAPPLAEYKVARDAKPSSDSMKVAP